jgi:nicotinate-nucleotide pyrophosphorylase (carboxylating)
MQRLSGVATLASRYVAAVAGTKARILDTRKTTPGLRAFEKYAVRVGGASNHRFGLNDGVLIKDNHIAAAGGVRQSIEATRRCVSHLMKIEVEAKELSQVSEALGAGADVILLDNMDLATMSQAVALVNGRALTEASGGVNLTTVLAIARTGVDFISVGALTHSAPALDISLDLQ